MTISQRQCDINWDKFVFADAIIKRRMFAKARSKSAPTSSSDRKEKAILYSSLRDDLDKSLLQMDLLAKGLLTFSSSKLGNTTN